jgi:hypothetical protein
MARFDVTLQPGAATGTDVYLRRQRQSFDIYLYATNEPRDVYLRPNWNRPYPDGPAGGPAFPPQYAGLRVWDDGAAVELCVVAEADAPSGMGGVLKLRQPGETRVVYLVETHDSNASTVRIQTTTGTKAIRKKT